MAKSFFAIDAERPHFADLLEYIRQSPDSVFRYDISKDMPHIPDQELNNDLRFATQNGFCEKKRVSSPQHRGQSIVGYGPLTSRGERYLESAASRKLSPIEVA